MESIKQFFKDYKWYFIIGLLLLVSVLFNVRSCKEVNEQKDINNNNIVALTDSINYYKTENDELVASKTLLEGDLETLRLAYNEVCERVESMEVEDPHTVVYIKSEVTNPERDTVWVVKNDTSYQERNFAFNDKYRSLEGVVFARDTTLGLNINKDKVFFDYTLAVEDNKVCIVSDNPYVSYNEICGITIPKPKKYRMSVGVGLQVGYGYEFQHKNWGPYVGVGVGLQYNLLNFWAK